VSGFTRRLAVRASASVLVALALSTSLGAQENNSLAVGINYTNRLATDPNAHGDGGVGFKTRFGHSETGWGWHYGLNWYSTTVDRSIGQRRTTLGELKVRPILVGYGYTIALTDRLSLTGDVIGGAAYSTFRVTSEAYDAFHAVGAEAVHVRAGFTPVIKPEASMWYDINRRFGLSLDGGYIIARPPLAVSTSLGREKERFTADTWTISTGIVYRIF